jgi:hypothetical protein
MAVSTETLLRVLAQRRLLRHSILIRRTLLLRIVKEEQQTRAGRTHDTFAQYALLGKSGSLGPPRSPGACSAS